MTLVLASAPDQLGSLPIGCVVISLLRSRSTSCVLTTMTLTAGGNLALSSVHQAAKGALALWTADEGPDARDA